MPLRWFAIQSILPTKEKVIAKLVELGFGKEVSKFRNILTFNYESDALWVDPDESLLNGYALIQINTKNLEVISSILKKSKIGNFFNTNKQGVPYPISEDEVKEFKAKVRDKKQEFVVGDDVIITDGMFIGLRGRIKKKKKLMAEIEIALPHRKSRKWINVLSLKYFTGKEIINWGSEN
jgi:transcription antitermination factor NusG